MTQTASIFIGYRRHDSQGFAGRVADDLIDRFSHAHVFRDDEIPEGSDFTQVLDQALNTCSVLIAVIGPNWLQVPFGQTTPRLFEQDDWVRREIEVALQRNLWVLPVLVGNATMPSGDELPATIRAITNVQAISLSDRQWERDMDRLVSVLAQRIPVLAQHNSTSLTQHQQMPEHQTPSLSDALEKLAKALSDSRARKPPQPQALSRRVKSILVRLAGYGALLLAGWYMYDNHMTPQIKQELINIIAFVRSKAELVLSTVGN